jgi:predicted RNase H-like HicB family nuclease
MAKLVATQKHLKVKVVFYHDGTGGYTVVAKALPGCIAEGDTREEALAEFREALQGYLQSTSGTFEMEEGGIEEEIEL